MAGRELFPSYTCTVCGRKLATWAAFRRHRVEEQPCRMHASTGSESWEKGDESERIHDAPTLGEEDRAVLERLARSGGDIPD